VPSSNAAHLQPSTSHAVTSRSVSNLQSSISPAVPSRNVSNLQSSISPAVPSSNYQQSVSLPAPPASYNPANHTKVAIDSGTTSTDSTSRIPVASDAATVSKTLHASSPSHAQPASTPTSPAGPSVVQAVTPKKPRWTGNRRTTGKTIHYHVPSPQRINHRADDQVVLNLFDSPQHLTHMQSMATNVSEQLAP
jgi:hypothetical protein